MPKTADQVKDWIHEQLHAGHFRGESVWHTTTDGRWWCGFMFGGNESSLTAQQLLKMVRTVETDLLALYPNLK